jgi:hypothetical protein
MESSQSVKTKRPLSIEEEDLVDKDQYIFDLVLSFNLFEIHQLAMQNFRDLVNYYHAWESELAKFIVPQTYYFLEFVTWCVSYYNPSQRSLVSRNGLVLFEVNSQLISKLLKLPLNPESEILDEIVLAQCFRELNSQDRIMILQSYICQNLDVPVYTVILKTYLFLETSRQIITMMTTILGNDNDLTIDEYVLGFMISICPHTVKHLSKFNYAQHLANNIHHQLSEFETTRYFRYQSYSVYLLMYSKVVKFSHLGLKTEYEMGNPSASHSLVSSG